jgi:lipopolysaccharide export system protein LptA
MLKEKFPAIGRVLSLVLLIATIAVIVGAFIRARKQTHPTGFVKDAPVLTGKITSIIEGYKYVKTEDGRETLRLLAAKDTAYEDGRHELEKVDLTALGVEKGKSMRILADRGSYLRDQSQVEFNGNVVVTSSDGLEVKTEFLKYDQGTQVASTDRSVQFRRGDVNGSSLGASLFARERDLHLSKDPRVVITRAGADPDPNKKTAPPVEIKGNSAVYVEGDGVLRFEGQAAVAQGERLARADQITGVVNPQSKKLERIEMRGNSFLNSDEKSNASEVQSRDMDFHFDEEQRLKAASARGAARARSLERDSPREIAAEIIEIAYKPNEKSSDIQSVSTQGRTVIKLEAVEGAASGREASDRVIEADTAQAFFAEDGRNLVRAEASGNAVLTITPKRITPDAERKTLRAAKFNLEFYETGNAIKTFIADGNAIAEFEPLQQSKEKPRSKKTLSGKKLTANFNRQTQEIADLTVEGESKFTDGDRTAVAARGIYTASSQTVAMRGKPQLWDQSARANADEIDVNLDTDESDLRGRVRTTYFSREQTGGAAPFKKRKSPVTIASDRALVKHREGAARYTGNARAWQDDDFIRADAIELDKGERVMNATGNAQSAFYDFERELEKGRKEVVPVFASSDRIAYNDNTRTVHYEGSVKIRQGTDRIEAAVADALMDEEHKLISLTASKNVVMTQPSRRATGDQVVYTASSDTAVLTGELAMVEDKERDAVTKSPKLTLHLRDARIESNDDSSVGSGPKRRVKTTHRIQN